MKKSLDVLIVDDNPDLLKTFALILRKAGISIEEAEDGLRAVELTQKHHYDMVLMDIIMPRMNGIEALEKIKANDPAAKVVLMTAYCEEQKVAKALQAGALTTLQKPVSIKNLLETIGKIAPGVSIVVVDDDASIGETLTRALKLKGYEAYYAGSGEEAIRISREKGVGLALIDIKMPVMDGLETCLKLKEENPDIQNIIMTAYRDEARELVDKALVETASSCLYKPFDPAEVIKLVDQITART